MKNELASWAKLIQIGMGIVDFKSISTEDANFLLDPSKPRDYAYWLRLAKNVPDDVCEIARTALPKDVQQAMDHRLNEVRIGAGLAAIVPQEPVADYSASASSNASSWWQRTKASFSAALSAFDEEPTEWDSVDGSDFELPERSLELVPKPAPSSKPGA